MMRVKLENVFLLLLMMLLIAALLIIRKGNDFIIIQTAILVVTILYIIIKKVKKEPVKIIENKMDIAIIVFTVSTFIPIVFKSYTSFHTSLTVSLNYVCLFFWYILIKNIVNHKKIEYVNALIIVQAVILVIVGIENLTTNRILPLLGIDNIINGENRLVSFMGNPNVLAGFLSFSFFIALHKGISTKKIKQKVMFHIANIICVIGILLTYSKAIYILMPIITILYIILLKDKEKNREIYIHIIIYLLLALSYVMIFNKVIAMEQYVFVWVYLVLILLLEALLSIMFYKIEHIGKKIKTTYVIIILSVLITIGIYWVIGELNHIIPYEVFSNNNTINYAAKKINNVKGNEKYVFSFDIYSTVYDNIEDMYEINIIERDKKNYEIKNTSFIFGNYEGIKVLEIITHENTAEFKIEFKSKYQYIDRKLTIKQLTINDKIIPLQYKNLPIKIVDKIKDISFNYKTVQERLVFMKEALKLAKENLLTGIGGENWQYRYGEIQEYDYTSSDIHSYPVQVLVEFGIIGLISLIYIYFCIIKTKDKKYLGMKIGFFIIILHSAMDSEMKFPFIQLIVYTYLGIFSMLDYKKEKKNHIIIENIYYVISVIIAITTIAFLYKSNPYEKISSLESKQIGLNTYSSEYKNYNQKIAKQYEELIKVEKSNLMENYVNILTTYINLGQIDKIGDYHEKVKEYVNKSKQKPEKIIQKSNGIMEIIRALEKEENPELYEWISQFSKIQIEEYEKTKQELELALKNKYEKLEDSLEYMNLEQNYAYAKKVYEKYILGVPIINQSNKEISADILVNPIHLETKDIILYHTHTTEAYNPSEAYEEIEYKKTLNENYNVLKIGDVLTSLLENSGYQVIHIRDYHDLLGVNGAYNRAKETLQEVLQEKQAQIILDIHRDAGNGETVTINDKQVAKMRFVVASGYEKWEERLNWAVTIQKKADKIYPGLFKPILIYNNTYNQEMGKYATLLEVGDDVNTIEEAENAIQLFANILEEILQQQ